MRNLIITLLFIAASANLHAQCDLITPLKSEGFENLIQTNKDGELQLHYENRRYRFEGLALQKVLEIFILKIINEKTRKIYI